MAFLRSTSLLFVVLPLFSCGGGGGSTPQPSNNIPASFTQSLPQTATCNLGSPCSFPLAATGTPIPAISCSVTSGPGSATFSNGNAVYTPASAGTATLSCSATNSVGSPATTSSTITVPQPAPQAIGVSPVVVVPNHSGFTLTVTGKNFVSGATVQVNGSSTATTFINSGSLTAQIPASDVVSAGQLAVTVKNPDGSVSNSVSLIVGTIASVASIAAATITSSSTSDEFGRGLKNLGNITGIVGQGDSALAATSDTGVYVIFNPEKLSGSFTSSQIGTAAVPGVKFVYNGSASPGNASFGVAPAGDVDGDGINDFLVSSNVATSDPNNKPFVGTVFVVRGGAWLTTHSSPIDLNDSTLPIVRMEGVNKNAFAGQSLCDGADFNGDGKADICFAMPGYGFDTNLNSAPGAVFVVFGGAALFASKSLDLTQVGGTVPGFFVTRDTSRTPISDAGTLGSTGPGSQTVVLADFDGDAKAELVIGDSAAQNHSPNTQKAYVVFGSASLQGKFFIEDIGSTFSGATLFTDRQNCNLSGSFCNQAFGSAVVVRQGSLIVADEFGAIVGSSLGGMAVVYQEPLTNGQNLDIRTLAANQQSSNLWNHSANQERFGFTLKDGNDVRLLSVVSFDSNRGKVVIIPGSNLPLDTLDAASTTLMTLTGENQGDLFGVGLDRLPTAYLLGSPGNGVLPTVPGKVYVVPNKNLLF